MNNLDLYIINNMVLHRDMRALKVLGSVRQRPATCTASSQVILEEMNDFFTTFTQCRPGPELNNPAIIPACSFTTQQQIDVSSTHSIHLLALHHQLDQTLVQTSLQLPPWPAPTSG